MRTLLLSLPLLAYLLSSQAFASYEPATRFASIVIPITANGSALTKGTTAEDRMDCVRQARYLYCQGQYRQTATGGAGSGSYVITLPNSLQASSSAYPSAGYNYLNQYTVGTIHVGDGSATSYAGFMQVLNATQLKSTLYVSGTPTLWSAANYGPFSTNNMVMSFDFKVAIEGW